jgi:hypothetical protein
MTLEQTQTDQKPIKVFMYPGVEELKKMTPTQLTETKIKVDQLSDYLGYLIRQKIYDIL